MISAPSKVLVIDDEPQIRRFLRTGLSVQPCEVIEAATGEEGLGLCAVEQPDIVVLDLNLPDINGHEVLRRLREWSDVPVIVLSAEDSDRSVIQALDSGASDYVIKPFKMAVFMARLRASFRSGGNSSASQPASPVLESGALRLDHGSREVWLGEERIDLTPKEFDLLALLMKHDHKVLTHKFLLEHVWGPANVDDREYLRVFIKQLREKIEASPAHPERILTETGIGYRLVDPDDDSV